MYCRHFIIFYVIAFLLTSLPITFGAEVDFSGLSFRPIRKNSTNSYTQIAGGLQFSPDGKLLAVALKDGTIRLWSMESGSQLRVLKGHKRTHSPIGLSFSPDGKRLVSLSRNNSSSRGILVWSTSTGEILAEHQGMYSGAVKFTPDGKYYVAANRASERTPGFCYFDSRNFSFSKNIYQNQLYSFFEPGHMEYINFSKDGSKLLANRTLFDFKNRKFQKLNLSWPVFSPDGSKIAGIRKREWRYENNARANYSYIVIYDAKSLTEVQEIPRPFMSKYSNDYETWQRANHSQLIYSTNGQTIYALFGNRVLVHDAKSGKLLKIHQCEYRNPEFIAISPDGRWLAESAYSKGVNLVNLEKNETMIKLNMFANDDEWALQTPDGYFDYSPETLNPYYNKWGSRTSSEDFIRTHHRPNIIQRVLQGMTAEDALQLPSDAEKPHVALSLVSITQDDATFNVVATPKGAGVKIDRARVTVNGREFQSTKSKAIQVVGTSQPSQWNITIDFPPGKNKAKVEVTVYDSVGQVSDPASIIVARPNPVSPVSGRLFVLTVGVSKYERAKYNLDYCHRDAEAIIDFFRRQEGKAFGEVQLRVYTDKQATRTNLLEGLDWLKRSCTPKDTVIVSFSGHGIKKERGLYYMTHEANIEGVQYTCLNWESMAKSLKNTQAGQIIFFADACYAGSFGEAKLANQQELAKSLREIGGVLVYTSSKSSEVSLERAEWGHGAFTKAILEGLNGAADNDNDNAITIFELTNWTTKRVIQLTNDKQHPVIHDLTKYDPNLVIANVK